MKISFRLLFVLASVVVFNSCSKEEKCNPNQTEPETPMAKTTYVSCPDCPILIWGDNTPLTGDYPTGSFYCPPPKDIICYIVMDLSDEDITANTVGLTTYQNGNPDVSYSGILLEYHASDDLLIETGTATFGKIKTDGEQVLLGQ